MRSRLGQLVLSWALPQEVQEPEQPVSRQALELRAAHLWPRQQPAQLQVSEERRVSVEQGVPA